MTVKKAIMIGLVCAALAALGATAYAGWGGCCGFYFVGSVETELTIKGGSSDDAFVMWNITPSLYEFVCLNPAGNEASTTVLIREVPLSDVEPIDQDEGAGRNGKPRVVAGEVDTGVLGDDPNDCVNPNWQPQPRTVLVRDFVASAEVFTLDDSGAKTTEFLATYDCEYLGPITAEALIPLIDDPDASAEDLFPDPDDRKYECTEEILQK